MKRLIKILFFSVFAFVLSMSFGMVSTDALESYVIGEDVDFANSLGQGYIVLCSSRWCKLKQH